MERRRPPSANDSARVLEVSSRAYPGARVARVAVDDETWEAFRATCGARPASVRLGQLVEADVKRARASGDADYRVALRHVRERLDALEKLLPP